MDQCECIMINRFLSTRIKANLKKGQVCLLFGARRTGKTTLMNYISKSLPAKKVLQLNGEDYEVASILSSQKQETFKSLLTGYDYLFIDEAQNIPNIGQNLKLIVDTQPYVAVLATGSASFDLKNKTGEPLTGRSRVFTLFPFSTSEINGTYLDALRAFPEQLVFGNYPQVILENSIKEKRLLLENIRNGYLLKDILQLENLKDSLFVLNLLKLIAFQIGNDISYNELSRNLNTTVKTIKRYLEILEKAFVIFSLPGFSRNLRKEISKTPRYYFWDNGIRNVLVSNFNTLETRDDVGKLWENYCISERLKKQTYLETFSAFHFWRTYDRQEIDLIELTDGYLKAFEFKWGEKEAKIPKAFKDSYPNATFQTINRQNFFDFLKL